MQRQSLGSPASKLQINEENRKISPSPSPESSPSTISQQIDIKLEKPLRRLNPKPDSSIHLLPILILLCFTILYLCSHEPSPEDLVIFVGFSSLLSEHRKVVEKAGGGLGIRSHRALKEAGIRNRNRKMGFA